MCADFSMRINTPINSSSRRVGYGFTLLELLSVLGIIAALAAIALPVIINARKKSYEATCLSNLRQLGSALLQYTQDYDGAYSPVASTVFDSGGHSQGSEESWHTLISPYLSHTVLFCPSRVFSKSYDEHPYLSGYAMNYYLSEQQRINKKTIEAGKTEVHSHYPALTIGIFDVRGGIIAYDRPDVDTIPQTDVDILAVPNFDAELKAQVPGALRHKGRGNYAFLDGHVRSLKADHISTAAKCEGKRPCFGL